MADLDVPIALRRARRSSSRGAGNAGMTTTGSVKKQRDDMDTDAEPDSDTRATKKLHTLPPQTPRRRTRQKIVHFPDGQEATQTDSFLSSGLTPMIRRTSIHFPGQQRRQANGNSSSSSKHLGKKRERRDTTPFSRSLGQIRALSTSSTAKVPSYNVFEAPRQHRTVDGRVERRIRRNNTRLLVNKVEQEKRRKTWEAQKEIRHLRSEIQSRDREIYQYQNATMVMDTERIWHLEGQIEQLKRELLAKEEAAAAPSVMRTGYPDPKGGHVVRHERQAPIGEDGFSDEDLDTVANQGDDEPEDCDFDDGYDGGYDDDDDLISSHHDGHGTDMSQFVARTPSSRLRSSFPTPPATSPTVPASPCVGSRSQNRLPACSSCPTVLQQAREHKAEELASLQLEVAKLTATLDSYKNMASRLKEQLAAVDLPPCSSPLSAPPSSLPGSNDASSSSSSTAKVLEGKVAALLQEMSDRTASIAHLTTSIARLGFPGANTDEMMGALATGFRAARLELEYLTPGEISLPLTLHGAEVLDLLLVRLRELAKRAQEDEACIDEYHETEQSLRKQLDARVTIMDELRGKVAAAEQQLEAQHVANQRLRGAVDGYVRDMSELEKLVERMEQDHGAQCEEKDASIRELERRLADAVRHTTSLQREMSDVQDSTTRHVVALNKRHGKALALSDARVLELRGELDRVNHSLRAAHETICGLRVETGRLQTERDVAREAMDSIKTELQRVLQMGGGVGGGGGGGNGGGGSSSSTKSLTTTSSSSCCCVNAVAAKSRRDPLQDELASSSPPSSSLSTTVGVGRRSSNGGGGGGNKKRRRRYDSGLGLLDEEEADMF